MTFGQPKVLNGAATRQIFRRLKPVKQVFSFSREVDKADDCLAWEPRVADCRELLITWPLPSKKWPFNGKGRVAQIGQITKLD